MRKAVAVLLCACAFAACKPREIVTKSKTTRIHTTVIPENEARKRIRGVILPVPAPVDKVLLGAQLGPDGAVATEASQFQSGQPIYLTLRLHDSPVGLKTSAVWFGPSKKEIHSEQRDMNGGKIATFALNEKLTPGKYHVEGHWGGNLAGDKVFDVVALGKKKSR